MRALQKKPLEKNIENTILGFLNLIPGCFAWKSNTVGIYDPVKKIFRKSRNKYAINGVSDILGVFRGKFLAIEVKRPDNKKRPEDQISFITQIKKNDGIAFFASSVEDVKRELGI